MLIIKNIQNFPNFILYVTFPSALINESALISKKKHIKFFNENGKKYENGNFTFLFY